MFWSCSDRAGEERREERYGQQGLLQCLQAAGKWGGAGALEPATLTGSARSSEGMGDYGRAKRDAPIPRALSLSSPSTLFTYLDFTTWKSACSAAAQLIRHSLVAFKLRACGTRPSVRGSRSTTWRTEPYGSLYCRHIGGLRRSCIGAAPSRRLALGRPWGGGGLAVIVPYPLCMCMYACHACICVRIKLCVSPPADVQAQEEVGEGNNEARPTQAG